MRNTGIERRYVTVNGRKISYTYNLTNRQVRVGGNLLLIAESYGSAPHEVRAELEK
jgi:hypothetical protein